MERQTPQPVRDHAMHPGLSSPAHPAGLSIGHPAGHRLNEATAVLWRGAGTVQLELGGRRLVIDNVSTEQLAALLARPEIRDPATAASVAVPAVQPSGLQAVLLGAGFLVTAADAPDWPGRATPAHLAGDLAALAERFGDEADSVLSARREAAVAVHGTSRLAATVAATMAAAGVGWVQLVHGGDVRAADSCPGGLAPADEGRRFGVAASDAVRRACPDVDTTPIPADRAADLVILTDPAPVDSAVRASMHLDGLAHLACAVRGSEAVIGPLVIPGATSCLRCADLHRADRDPAWPVLVVQLGRSPRHRTPSDVALCVATAGVAATQALAYLDRQQPATLDGTLEWQLPDWRLRRRSWPAHLGCDCGASMLARRTRHNGTVTSS